MCIRDRNGLKQIYPRNVGNKPILFAFVKVFVNHKKTIATLKTNNNKIRAMWLKAFYLKLYLRLSNSLEHNSKVLLGFFTQIARAPVKEVG